VEHYKWLRFYSTIYNDTYGHLVTGAAMNVDEGDYFPTDGGSL